MFDPHPLVRRSRGALALAALVAAVLASIAPLNPAQAHVPAGIAAPR